MCFNSFCYTVYLHRRIKSDTLWRVFDVFEAPGDNFDCIFSPDLSKRILRDVVTDRLSPPSPWVKKRVKTPQVDLLYQYRVICDEFYYSNSCAQICRHRNDNFGHYVCDETGSKVCLPGWQGEFCQEGSTLSRGDVPWKRPLFLLKYLSYIVSPKDVSSAFFLNNFYLKKLTFI